MTDAEALALGRRAIACRGWRWTSGMLVLRPGYRYDASRGFRVCDEHVLLLDDSGRLHDTYPGDESEILHEEALPDLRDPATLGCLLALVRAAWGDPTLVILPVSGPIVCWQAFLGGGDRQCSAEVGHEGEAIVAALEAAPDV